MRNLFLFLIRFNYVFAFLILEIISLAFVIRNHSYQRTGFLNSAGVITGNVYKTYFSFSEYLGLREVNEKLMRENAMLRMRQHLGADTLAAVDICDDSANIRYHFIPVKVINFSVNKATNYITLDKGSSAGIRRDMGVVTSTGVAGIVNHVSRNFSTAMSLLHKDSRISIKVKRFNYPGTLQWNGGSPSEAEAIGIPIHLPVAVGDSLVTSGFSAIFPENIPVGVISELSVPAGSSFYSITIKLSANLETLQYAYVVNNLYQKEQRELEAINNND
jgi:rod shape-determining protein MreC